MKKKITQQELMEKILGEYTITGKKKKLTKRTITAKKKPLKKRTVTAKTPLKKRHVTHPSGPGKSYRKGVSLLELLDDLFPDEQSAREWFEGIRWADGRYCGYCDSENTKRVPNEKPMPYWCSDCKRYFSIKTGTPMHGSPIPLRKWVIAFYLITTSLKGVSSMKIHRDLNITQKTAWYMIHRIREALAAHTVMMANGPVEVDETYVGGKNRNKHASKKLKSGRGPVGKTAVVGMKDRQTNRVRAAAIEHADQVTLHAFVNENIEPGTTIYTDDHRGYLGLDNHESVKHSVGQYVEGKAHTNGIESFWATLKRGYYGTYHKMSVKHLHRYVAEFAGRHNIRSLDTIEQMAALAVGMVGKRLRYKDLIK